MIENDDSFLDTASDPMQNGPVNKIEHYTVSDLAEALKVPASKVKHWVNVGLIEPVITCKGGVKIFNTMGLLRAMNVRRYREERYTIAEIKEMLK